MGHGFKSHSRFSGIAQGVEQYKVQVRILLPTKIGIAKLVMQWI